MRIPLIDPVKALAAQVIVFHHLMLYSSMRGPLEEAFPLVVGFLADPARYAVQVFLVIGGFLTAQSFSKRLSQETGTTARPIKRMGIREIGKLLLTRYKRLARPFALAILLACAALVWVQQLSPVIELAPAEPLQLLAHLLLLHDLTNVPALSAGVWYVAIDFQLYALATAMAAIALLAGSGDETRTRHWFMLMVYVLTLSSLWVFNRMPDLDSHGIYFFGSYGLGMLAFFAVQMKREDAGLLTMALLVGGALLLEYRERLWVTGASFLFLLLAAKVQTLPAWFNSGFSLFCQRSSYALFLVHYPMSIVLFVWVEQQFWLSAEHNLMAAGLCWAIFMAGAWALMRAETLVYDETPSALGQFKNRLGDFRIPKNRANAPA